MPERLPSRLKQIEVPESAFEKSRQLVLLRVIRSEMQADQLELTQSYKLVVTSIQLLENGHSI
ncbi:MAG TPA: hypothetical protein PLU21_01000 [Candidatus Saccharibacteria bacterium]|nr:hypothetical protein [Candidatus Saccharibacteria bacterium]